MGTGPIRNPQGVLNSLDSSCNWRPESERIRMDYMLERAVDPK